MSTPARRAWREQQLKKRFAENYGVQLTSEEYLADLADAMACVDKDFERYRQFIHFILEGDGDYDNAEQIRQEAEALGLEKLYDLKKACADAEIEALVTRLPGEEGLPVAEIVKRDLEQYRIELAAARADANPVGVAGGNMKTLEQCRQRATQIWCEPQHAHKVMDCDFAESIAKALMEQPTPADPQGVRECLERAIRAVDSLYIDEDKFHPEYVEGYNNGRASCLRELKAIQARASLEGGK